MNTTDSANTSTTIQQIDLAPSAPVQDSPLFKTEHGFNVNVIALAQQARKNMAGVQTICIPAIVKRHRTNFSESEGPVLSEVGGGASSDFCQVLADSDGRPISVDNILYLSSDPARASINHGSASIQVGNYISFGWKQRSDQVILLYVIVDIGELPQGEYGRNSEGKLVAKLTCELVGYYMATWRGPNSNIPQMLMPLYGATTRRMRNDLFAPFYMDMLRMVKITDEAKDLADRMHRGDVQEDARTENTFMSRVIEEILDIRNGQYERLGSALLSTEGKRKVETLRAVETLVLNKEDNYVDIAVTFPRDYNTMAEMITMRLTPSNFTDEFGAMVVERGLVLNCQSYYRLRAQLENRHEDVTVVNLLSLR